MTKSIIAALLAAGFAVLIAPYARAGTTLLPNDVPALTWQYYNVTLAVPRSGYNAKAMANSFCRAHLHRGAAEHTAAMINPRTAFFSYINCVGRT